MIDGPHVDRPDFDGNRVDGPGVDGNRVGGPRDDTSVEAATVDDGSGADAGSRGSSRREGRDVRQATTSSGGAIDPDLAGDLSALARELQAETDPQAVMQRIVEAAVREIAPATAAAITLVHKGDVTSPAHSSDLAARVGRIQSRTGEGPCVDTARQELTVRSDDLRAETRWPKFAAEAVEQGVLSVISFQLFVESDSMGALDVYSDTAGAFDADAENVGLLLASHAAIAMSASRKAANLYAAVESRDLIGQAKGILMERFKVSSTQAFDLLILSSQNNNIKLRDIAERLTTTGELAVRARIPTH